MPVKQHPDIKYFQELAITAGLIAKQHWSPMGVPEVTKDDHTPLTKADEAINDMVVESLRQHFPHIAVLGEEGSRFFPAEYVVLLDPIDGTIPFTYGCGSSAFMITLLKGGVPIMALIYGFITGHMWWAEAGRGAFLNGTPIRVSDNKVLMRQPGKRPPAVWLGTWKDAGWNLEELYAPLVRRGVHATTEYTLGYYGGLLASGKVDATIFPGHAAWETAALDVIVREAGGVICDLHGKPMTYNLVENCSPKNRMISGHVTANCPEIRDELLGMIWEIKGNSLGVAAA